MPQKMAIIFIDLDAFKKVNDTLGHDKGDLLLKEVTVRLKTIFRGTDLLSRLGGDEFVALLTRITKESLIIVSERIKAAFSEPFVIGGHKLVIGASVGISICPDDGEELETLIRNADHAMYNAKAKGKNTYQFYNKSLG
jgi:diguanylate cyclase (GGDEF)-like protein